MDRTNIFHEIASSVADLVSRKNRDYGSSYWDLRDEWGPMSFGIRLGDKYNRISNLLKREEAPEIAESIEDTIRDIIGYCLLELAYLQEVTTDDGEKEEGDTQNGCLRFTHGRDPVHLSVCKPGVGQDSHTKVREDYARYLAYSTRDVADHDAAMAEDTGGTIRETIRRWQPE